MDIRPCIKYVGVNDHEIDLFEGQYIVPNGMAYNSYVIVDQKIAVMDTVDACFIDRWLDNIESVLDGRTPDYLVVQHMEPDHSSGIQAFADRYPEAQIVSNAKAFPMMQAFFGEDYASRRVLAADGVTLSLGERTLAFVTAPMVHWPEVILTYIPEEKVLFSADAFGKFGALDVEEEWDCEARRYYIGIVGKFGAQVQAVLKKAAALSIECICPLHGPVLTGDGIKNALEKYQIWSTYAVEDKGVTIVLISHNMDDVARMATKVAVLDKGRLAMHGTPREVFARGDELAKMGLDVPQTFQLCRQLRNGGLNVPDCLTDEELADAIAAALKGGNAHA